MISIIVSSYQEEYFIQFEQNVAKTIGVAYEIVRIRNPGLMGICEAYNKGAALARYETLCFCHEDIVFETQNWGQNVMRIFEDSTVGLIGVAGAKHKTFMPSGWAFPDANYQPYHCVNVVQEFKFSNLPSVHYCENPDKEKIAEVAVVDGLWMCTRKQIIEKIPFDEKNFTHFHGYDLDISMQISQYYRVVVMYDVLIRHFSEGNMDTDWVREISKLHAKWSKQLPLNRTHSSKPALRLREYVAFDQFMFKLVELQLPSHIAFSYLWRHFLTSVQVLGSYFFLRLNLKLLLGIWKKHSSSISDEQKSEKKSQS